MKRIAALLLMFFMVIPQVAFADSMDLAIKGGDNVKAGETFEITVSYSAADIDWVDGQLKYDTSVLSYIYGGSSSGDGSIVSLKEASDNGKEITFRLKFKAIASGTSDLSVETSEAYDFNGRLLNFPQAQKSVKVEEKEEITSEDDEEEKEETEVSEEDEPETEEAEDIEDVDRNVGPLNFYLICGTAIAAFLLVILLCIAARRKRRNKR